MKKTIRYIFNKLGYQIEKKYLNHNFDDIESYLLGEMNSPMIFDVGANVGQSILRFKKNFPLSTIHSFEPDTENFDKLKAYAAEDVIVNNFGIADKEAKLTFNRIAQSGASSFLRLKPGTNWTKVRSRQFSTVPEQMITASYQVPVSTLDGYCEKRGISHINLLKIDTQGYEDKVLAGGAGLLSKQGVDIVELELIVEDVYEKALNFSDIEKFLLPHGYRLFALKNEGDMLSSLILQFDLIYVSEGLLRKHEGKKPFASYNSRL